MAVVEFEIGMAACNMNDVGNAEDSLEANTLLAGATSVSILAFCLRALSNVG